jgi:5-formyltetrahydrofolate cyclo-ligase
MKALKARLRTSIWELLMRQGVARPPFPITGRIPNFEGSREACERAWRLPALVGTKVVKVNPDSPQAHFRYLALASGWQVLMPTPRLRSGFLLIGPLHRDEEARRASTIRGAFLYGKRARLDELLGVDAVVVGSVAVNQKGARLGKGGGYSDLEYAMLREAGKLNEDTPVITIVHDLQVVDLEIPMEEHDLPVDIIVTPTRTLLAERAYPKPKGVLRGLVSPDVERILRMAGVWR